MIRKTLIPTFLLFAGCALQAAPKAGSPKKVDFVTEVKPIFEAVCIGCHNEKKDKGDYRMDTKELAFKGGESFEGEAIVPGKPDDSAVYWMTTLTEKDEDADLIMPPEPEKNPSP